MKQSIIVLILISLFSCTSETKQENTVLSDSISTDNVTELPSTENKKDSAIVTIQNPKNILEYYQLLKNKNLVEPYTFSKVNNEYKCFNVDDNEISYSFDLDIQNGYLSIIDEGTGAGEAHTELALFKKTDGNYIIAVNYYYKEASGLYIMITSSKLDFYEYAAGEITTITTTCFKNKVYSTSFLKPTYAGDDEIEFNYLLPKKGTTIKAILNQDYLTFCKTKEQFQKNMDKEVFEKISDKCLVCDQVVKNTISIPFNKAKGEFSFTE